MLFFCLFNIIFPEGGSAQIFWTYFLHPLSHLNAQSTIVSYILPDDDIKISL
jgi:hypothetical protein